MIRSNGRGGKQYRYLAAEWWWLVVVKRQREGRDIGEKERDKKRKGRSHNVGGKFEKRKEDSRRTYKKLEVWAYHLVPLVLTMKTRW